MSCFALRASALITLQAKAGEWVALPALMTHLAATEDRVRNVCQQLVADGLVHEATHAGVELYGSNVEGVQP